MEPTGLLRHLHGLLADVADEDVDRAAATRDAFWTAAKRGDAPAAKATLDGAAVKDARVYEYERGWLASRGK